MKTYKCACGWEGTGNQLREVPRSVYPVVTMVYVCPKCTTLVTARKPAQPKEQKIVSPTLTNGMVQYSEFMTKKECVIVGKALRSKGIHAAIFTNEDKKSAVFIPANN